MDRNQIAYVRHDVLPQAEPPATERGIVKWMRENLFSSIPNSVLTLTSIFVV